MKRPRVVRQFVAAATAAILTSIIAGSASDAGATVNLRIPVKVLVITMFDPETKPWLEKESLPLNVHIPGAYSSVRCNQRGLCVMTTGQGKSNTATSMTAVLSSARFDFSRSHFLTAGIAGVSPKRGTLGFAAWARWVVDLALGHHVLPSKDIPHGYIPYSDQGSNVFRLNEKLVTKAYDLTKNLKLVDNAESVANRKHFAGQRDKKPYVTRCDTLTGDNFWAGEQLSERARYVTGIWTKNQGDYCTTQMEDSATATVLARFGHLDRYLSLRTASDFDQPYPGQDIREHLKTFPAFETSVANAYTVGSAVAHGFLRS